MANSCTFHMELIGSENQINQFIVNLDNRNHRINNYSMIDNQFITEDVVKVTLHGLCDWNIEKSMLSDKLDHLNLVRASKEGEFSIEVFSEEDSQAFQEHFHVICGEVLTDESNDMYVFRPNDMTRDALELFLSLLSDYGVTIENYLDYLGPDGQLHLGGLDDYCVFCTENSLKKYLEYITKSEE